MKKKIINPPFISYSKIATLIACLVFASLSVLGKDKKTDQLEQRIANLENYKANLDQLYEIKSAQLKSEIIKSADEKMKEVEETKRIIYLILYIGLPATVLGLGGVYLSAIKKSKNLIHEKIERIVEHKREEFIKLIETQAFDSKLKKSKKIVVLSPSDNANEQIKQFFTKVKFDEVKFRVVNHYALVEDFDLIVFNDFDGSFSQEIINEYLINIQDEDVCFVAYTTKNLNRNHRVNFSNSPFTLYHSILSTLKYSEILKVSDV